MPLLLAPYYYYYYYYYYYSYYYYYYVTNVFSSTQTSFLQKSTLSNSFAFIQNPEMARSPIY